MSSIWPEPPKPGRGYPQQRWRRSPRRAWVVTLGLAACVVGLVVWLVVLP